MSQMRSRSGLVAALAFAAGCAFAPIATAVVRVDGTAGETASFPCSVKFTAPGDGTCSGTVIGGGMWIITAKHCTDGSNNGADYTFTNINGVSKTGMGTVIQHPTADLALIKLNGMYNDSYGLYMNTDEVGMEVCFPGWGRSSATPGGGNDELPSGTMRVGYNKITAAGGGLLRFTFDNTGTGDSLGNREGTTFGGDSGVGYFKIVSGVPVLAGVHSGILATDTVNTFGTTSVGVRVSDFKDWILTNIPAPSTGAFAAMGLLGFAQRRRRAA